MRTSPFKVTFVYYDYIKPGFAGMYYPGIASLSGSLKSAGFDTSLMHIRRPLRREEFLNQLEFENPDLAAFSSTTNVLPFIKEMIDWTKERFPALTTICGGPHAILSPQELIDETKVDIVCVGEGEKSLVGLSSSIRRTGRIDVAEKGLWIRKDGAVYKNQPELFSDLNQIPFPDKSIFDYKNLAHGMESVGVFMVSRGCPYTCAYCCNEGLMGQLGYDARNYVRFKSVDYVIEEIKRELNQYDFVKRLYFFDDILPLRKSWLEEFVVRYKEEIRLPFICNLRPNLVNTDTMDMLKEAGCYKVCIGIESGDELILNEVLHRNLSKENMRKAFGLCKEHKITTFSFSILGIPGEDMKSMLETVKFNAELGVEQGQISVFYPYPKTALYERCKEEGLITKNSLPNYEMDSVLAFGYIKKKQILFVKYYFRILMAAYKLLFKLPKIIRRRFIAGFDALLSSKFLAIFIYPILNGIMVLIHKNGVTFRLFRFIKRRIFEGGW